MNLDKKDNLELNNKKSPTEEHKNKSDLGKVLSECEKTQIIEKEYEALVKNIDAIITHNFLKKEYYENLPDGSNPEIDNICNYSASDLENRVKEGKGILYMNACISQTLYLIDKLKKQFPHLSKKMSLCVEILKLSKLNINNVHAFIHINIPDHEPIIIDYAHDNDVFIYQGTYTNRSSQAIKTESTHVVPVNSFDKNDTIFDIAIKGHMLNKGDFDPTSQELHNEFFAGILSSRKDQLKSHNSKTKFERWQKKNSEIRIFNSLHS